MIMDINVLIASFIGLFTTVIGSFVSWFFTRKKYKTEVDANELNNLKSSLDIYERIVTDMENKLKYYIELAESNRLEVYRLKEVVHRLLNNSCLDNNCTVRKFYTESEIRNILGTTKKEEDEIKA